MERERKLSLKNRLIGKHIFIGNCKCKFTRNVDNYKKVNKGINV